MTDEEIITIDELTNLIDKVGRYRVEWSEAADICFNYWDRVYLNATSKQKIKLEKLEEESGRLKFEYYDSKRILDDKLKKLYAYIDSLQQMTCEKSHQ